MNMEQFQLLIELAAGAGDGVMQLALLWAFVSLFPTIVGYTLGFTVATLVYKLGSRMWYTLQFTKEVGRIVNMSLADPDSCDAANRTTFLTELAVLWGYRKSIRAMIREGKL